MFLTERGSWSQGPPGRKGGGSRALVLAALPVGALDYVASSGEPSCCVSGSEVLRPFDTLPWGESRPPRPLDRFLPSDWDTSLSTSLSVCFPGGKGESLSEVSEPHEDDSESSVVNLRPTLGEAGGRRLHTCAWMCSHIRRNRRMFPERRMKLIA